jgi:hypothetical protein
VSKQPLYKKIKSFKIALKTLDKRIEIWYNKGTKKQKVGKIMLEITYSKGIYTITDNKYILRVSC